MLNYTRQDYISRNCTHREYYSQFVTHAVKDTIRMFFSLKTLQDSKDTSFNDIPLIEWDAASMWIRHLVGGKIKEANRTGGISLSDIVCTAKEAARQIVEESNKL